MILKHVIINTLALLCVQAMAADQVPPAKTPKSTASPANPAAPTLSPAQWAEAQSIIDDIKKQNPSGLVKAKFETGVIQYLTNFPDATKLGFSGSLIAVGAQVLGDFWGPWGIELKDIYAQNILPDSSSRNGSSTFVNWLDIGPRYTFYLDSTRLDNIAAIKLMYHDNYNNFLPNPGSESNLWVNDYTGIALGFERNIPVTNHLGIMGAFDLMQILSVSSPSINRADGTKNPISQSGYGFQIQAEIYYKIALGDYPTRLGISYWQQGNENEITSNLKSLEGQNSYFQLSRALFGTASVLF